MTAAKFEWDEKKDAENQAKHHVSFQDAQAAFADQWRKRLSAQARANLTPSPAGVRLGCKGAATVFRRQACVRAHLDVVLSRL